MSEQLDCSFYFMSCLCRHMMSFNIFASFVLHRSACGSRPSAQTFLQTFRASHATGRQFHIKLYRNPSTSGIIRNGQSPGASNMFSYVALDPVEFRGVPRCFSWLPFWVELAVVFCVFPAWFLLQPYCMLRGIACSFLVWASPPIGKARFSMFVLTVCTEAFLLVVSVAAANVDAHAFLLLSCMV